MLSWEEIESKTIWVIRYNSGYRETGTYEYIRNKYNKSDDAKDYDIGTWMIQPKELQDFWKAYDFACFELGRHDLMDHHDFYNEWSKNPSQFEPQVKKVIGTLSEALRDLDVCDDVIIKNFDGKTFGNHHVGNFIEALDKLDVDFNITSIDTSDKTTKIVTQDFDEGKCKMFDIVANDKAIEHDRFLGDGKYWRKEE